MKKKWKGLTTDWEVVSDMDNVNTSIACLTQREQAILLSALTPLKWRTRWTGLPDSQSLDFIDNLIGKLMTNSTCCETVLYCILNDTDVQDGIQDLIDGLGEGSSTENLGDGIAELKACQPDYIFGAVTELVKYLNTSAIDAFEILETATNFVEIITEWLDNYPVVQQLIAPITDYIAWIQDNIAENYDAQYTQALEDTYRCDLFCLWRQSGYCQLSLRDVANYFVGRLGGPGLSNTLLDLIDFLITGQWQGTQIVDAMFLAIVGVMSVETDFIPFITVSSVRSFETVIALGANSPDPDWSILCQTCPQTICQDFAEQPPQTDYSVILGSWTGGEGHPAPAIKNADNVNSATYPLNGSGTNSGIATAIEIELPSERSVVEVSFDYRMSQDKDTTVGSIVRLLDSLGNIVYTDSVISTTNADGEWHTAVFTMNETDIASVIVASFRASVPTVTGIGLIDNVCIK